MGVDIIEAGFPISSDGDFESVQAIAGGDHASTSSAAWPAATPKDIERAGEAVKHAQDRPHPRLLRHHQDPSRAQAEQGQGRDHPASASSRSSRRWSTPTTSSSRPEDASRTELEFLEEIVQAAIEAGATTINLPDTVGYATPKSYGEIFSHLLQQAADHRARRTSSSPSHCHDDLGLAVANSLAAVENGARQVECTINGIGERAGNAALEEIVMALRTRSDFYKIGTRIDTTKIYPASRMVSTLTGLAVQRNKAIVGENAFAHEVGHPPGRHAEVPRDLRDHGPGHRRHPQERRWCWASTPAGTRSATASQQLGYTLTDEQLEAGVRRSSRRWPTRRRKSSTRTSRRWSTTSWSCRQGLWELVGLQVTTGSNTIPTATVTLRDSNGETVQDASIGDGPVDAIYSAIQRLTGMQVSADRLPHPRGHQGQGSPGRSADRARTQRQKSPRPRPQHGHSRSQCPGVPGRDQPPAQPEQRGRRW